MATFRSRKRSIPGWAGVSVRTPRFYQDPAVAAEDKAKAMEHDGIALFHFMVTQVPRLVFMKVLAAMNGVVAQEAEEAAGQKEEPDGSGD